MIKQIKPAQSLADLLGPSIAQGLSGAMQQRQDRAQQQQYGEMLGQLGIDPAVAGFPSNLQNILIKNALKTPTWSDIAKGYVNGGPQRLGSLGTLTPSQEPGAQEPFNAARAALSSGISGGVPLGASALAAANPATAPLIYGGTAIEGGLGLTNLLGNLFGAKGNIAPTYPELQQMPIGATKQMYQQMGLPENVAAYKERKGKLNPLQLLPTLGQTTEAVRQTGEKAGLPTRAVTPGEKKLNKLAEVAGFLANPASWTQGPVIAAKNISKALGVSLGGDIASYLTKQLTGSDLLGKIVEGGLYTTYSMFPGTMKNMAEQGYNTVDAAIQEAEALGAPGSQISMVPYQDAFKSLVQEIEKKYIPGSEEYNFLGQEANRLRDLFYGAEVSPSALLHDAKSMSARWGKVPDQATPLFQKFIDLERQALKGGLDKIKPGLAKTFDEANGLYRNHSKVMEDIKDMATTLSPRKLGLGTAALFLAGYKPLLLGAAGLAGTKYVTAMLKDPTVRTTMNQLAKANALNNTALVNSLANKLNKQADRHLRKFSTTDQQRIKSAVLNPQT